MSVKKGLVTCLAIAAVCATFQQTVNADEVSGKQYTSSNVNQLVSSVKYASDEVSLSGLVSSPLVVGAKSVSGKAVPNSKVDVLVSGSLKATVLADAAGNWTAQVSALAKGQIVQIHSTLGDWSADSNQYQVVDKEPVVLTPLVVGETKIAGVAAPKSKVDVRVGGVLEASVYADEGGIWVAKVPALEVGKTVQMTASMGNWSADSARYQVASREPVVITPLVAGETKIGGAAVPNSKVDVWVGGSVKATAYADETGIWSAHIPALLTGQQVQIKSSINNLSLDSTQYQVVEKTPYLLVNLKAGGTKVAGVSAPCSQVNVWIDGAIAATVTTDETGIWVAKVPALAEGQVVQPKANIAETWYAEGASVTVVK
ncbi:hypothetical protein HB847_03620 [Listeria booriae]|uniref:Bacterial Ig domain-containing protein n=1 Tax=Listeria booriae TaxID=1552123 RepID=A0A841Y1F2_9LIST|nr:hypothetical protein [Listeria booriae]MBC1371446.1 hypothetical protein [Listeria booriae]